MSAIGGFFIMLGLFALGQSIEGASKRIAAAMRGYSS